MLTYAIGDVHGCAGHLARLLERIDRDAAGRPFRLVALGDLIDRGPDSAGAIALLRARQQRAPDRVVCLQGNHEDLLLSALDDPDRTDAWLMNGGGATLSSFGVEEAASLPPEIVAWIRGCPTAWEDERRVFVHAGLHPTRPRREQRDHDRLWIRERFLEAEHDFGRFVVHGHTPRIDGRPDLRRFRVNLDTAAVYGGRLTAGIFTDERDGPVGFLQVPG